MNKNTHMATTSNVASVRYQNRIAAALKALEARVIELEKERPMLERSTYLSRIQTVCEEREVLCACVHDAKQLSRRSVIFL